ncbi:unnamed protein product [Victoria cruziana]
MKILESVNVSWQLNPPLLVGEGSTANPSNSAFYHFLLISLGMIVQVEDVNSRSKPEVKVRIHLRTVVAFLISGCTRSMESIRF